ncbi:vWA domain-containing protein [Sporolituus thermophilus]|uniref:Magnesium chelatase subunit D n=1 Tax=Sporolituus thermophilus DSM 23256 TaxID=1123285 RepID=A0A1G7IEV3_9FIRM|nr:VWA domain-containing protein [Sporolituus thermophilus]SDF11046.1 magnesium chelatase subunit D [Sporolituus thermophilus DSM 23256]
MAEGKWQEDARFLTKIALPAERLADLIRADKGARIGQSTVVSQKLHIFNPAMPEEVQVLQDMDAGQIFYRRRNKGQVYHLDIFHQCGLVDHRQVAAAIKGAVNAYNFHVAIHNAAFFNKVGNPVKADWIDVQTGTGGGRVTGSLNFGKKLSLRRAHENHVHLAAMVPGEHIACLFYLVTAVENVIMGCQLELRQNERIVHKQGGGPGGECDLSPYADQTDSFLRDKETAQLSQPVKERQYVQDVVDLAEDFDSVREMRETLEALTENPSRTQVLRKLARSGKSEQVLDRLTGLGIATAEGQRITLTPYGREFKDYLERHLPDLEAHLRCAIRLLRPRAYDQGRSKARTKAMHGQEQRQAKRWMDGGSLGQLAVAETVIAAAQRFAAGPGGLFTIGGQDIHHFMREQKNKTDICLIIDASASMSGQRIGAAKFLAKHLLLSTTDRVAVVVFQENQVRVQVPLTRDFAQAENSLAHIASFGSTPLALGLKVSLEYLREARAKNPFIILITDGVPTVGDATGDPLADALTAAANIRRHGYGFTCIGLKPHRNYLAQVAQAAGGNIYVLDELEKHVLVQTARSECRPRWY